MDTISLDLWVDKKEIMFIHSVFESYEGVAFFRTLDPSIGHVLLMVSPSFIAEADSILRDLSSSLKIIPLNKIMAAEQGFSFFKL